jgi:hypothetical protein
MDICGLLNDDFFIYVPKVHFAFVLIIAYLEEREGEN